MVKFFLSLLFTLSAVLTLPNTIWAIEQTTTPNNKAYIIPSESVISLPIINLVQTALNPATCGGDSQKTARELLVKLPKWLDDLLAKLLSMILGQKVNSFKLYMCGYLNNRAKAQSELNHI